MARYKIYNGPMPTTAALVSVTTGTALKTMLQIKPSATLGMHVVEWGVSFDGSAAATPGKVELIETGTVAATVTASVANDLVKYDAAALMSGDPTTNLIQVGTAATGYTASAEGTITASRLLMADMVAPTNQFIYQFPLGERPFVQANNILRVRVHFAAAINMICWVVVEV